MVTKLPPHQYALIAALGRGGTEPTIENLAVNAGIDQALIMAAAVELESRGFITIEETPFTELKLGPLGDEIQRGNADLPERLIARVVRGMGGKATIKDLSGDASLAEHGIMPGKFAKNLTQLGWAEFEKGTLTLTPDALEDEPPSCDIEVALTAVNVAGGTLLCGAATDSRVLSGAGQVKGRKELLASRERKRREISLTESGDRLASGLADGSVTELIEVSELTPEMLADGSWRNVQFRPYDITLGAEKVTPGKPHPLARVIDEARLAFLELGFSEANCPMAEMAFWDFDALFQPQDHPAREMQDTFYLKTPSRYPLPGREDWVNAVKNTHENGWETGSKGWRYEWSAERAAQVVLRTHMTASSIRAIARNPGSPQKVFSIGKVFRRETVDYKHLPEFYQIDGIIIDDKANLASLLGTLSEFYRRMGLPEVRFKPDFFPYTEPSVGVEALVDGKWLELAGAGVFRPETTLPFGCSTPVLAWGMGLERLAMARFGISSIKDLIQSDFDWLKGVPLKA